MRGWCNTKGDSCGPRGLFFFRPPVIPLGGYRRTISRASCGGMLAWQYGYGMGARRLAASPTACYKALMKTIEKWLLYKYVDDQFTPLSKPFKTKAQAEKARLKYPERERGAIGVGVIRIKK
jgi:hypothetical protein